MKVSAPSAEKERKHNAFSFALKRVERERDGEANLAETFFPGSNHHELSCDRLNFRPRTITDEYDTNSGNVLTRKGGVAAESATGHGALISTNIQLDYDPYYRTSSCVHVSELALFIHLRQIIPLARGGATLKRVRAAECNARRFAKVQTRRNDVTPVCPASGLTNLNEPYKLRRTAIKGHALTRLSS